MRYTIVICDPLNTAQLELPDTDATTELAHALHDNFPLACASPKCLLAPHGEKVPKLFKKLEKHAMLLASTKVAVIIAVVMARRYAICDMWYNIHRTIYDEQCGTPT